MRHDAHALFIPDSDEALPHALEGHWCWCSPRFEVPCPACRDDDALRPRCRACATTGWVEVAASEIDPDAPCVIIHNREASPD